MTLSLTQRTPPGRVSVGDTACRLLVRPLPQALIELGGSLHTLFQQTPNPHPFLHPDSLAEWPGDISQVQLAALVEDDVLCCAGILDPWSLPVGRIPRTQLQWQLRGRRAFAKGLLWDGRKNSVVRWLQGLPAVLREHKWAGLMVEALAVDSCLWEAVLASCAAGTGELKLLRPQQLQPRWRVQLPETIDKYWLNQFKGKTRNTLRRKRKKLGDYRVEVCREPHEVDHFLKTASAISVDTWQSRQLGLRVKNDEYERRLFRTLASRGAFRGHIMWLAERPVAFVINTSHDGLLHYEETGFLPEVSHLSPGTVLVSELIDDVISSGEYHTIDFGLGHADYKQLFSNQQTESSDVWLLRNSPVNAIAAGMISTQEAVRDRARAALQQSGVLKRLKQLKARRSG